MVSRQPQTGLQTCSFFFEKQCRILKNIVFQKTYSQCCINKTMQDFETCVALHEAFTKCHKFVANKTMQDFDLYKIYTCTKNVKYIDTLNVIFKHFCCLKNNKAYSRHYALFKA